MPRAGSEIRFASGGEELAGYRARLFLAAALLTAVACGVVWLFMLRNRTIRAAERVDVYARQLERQNDELFEAKRRAESADRAKTEFLANVSLNFILEEFIGIVVAAEKKYEDDTKDNTFTQIKTNAVGGSFIH